MGQDRHNHLVLLFFERAYANRVYSVKMTQIHSNPSAISYFLVLGLQTN